MRHDKFYEDEYLDEGIGSAAIGLGKLLGKGVSKTGRGLKKVGKGTASITIPGVGTYKPGTGQPIVNKIARKTASVSGKTWKNRTTAGKIKAIGYGTVAPATALEILRRDYKGEYSKKNPPHEKYKDFESSSVDPSVSKAKVKSSFIDRTADEKKGSWALTNQLKNKIKNIGKNTGDIAKEFPDVVANTARTGLGVVDSGTKGAANVLSKVNTSATKALNKVDCEKNPNHPDCKKDPTLKDRIIALKDKAIEGKEKATELKDKAIERAKKATPAEKAAAGATAAVGAVSAAVLIANIMKKKSWMNKGCSHIEDPYKKHKCQEYNKNKIVKELKKQSKRCKYANNPEKCKNEIMEKIKEVVNKD